MTILIALWKWILSNKRWSLIILLSCLYFGQIAYTNHLAKEINKIKLKNESDKSQAVIDAINKIKPIEIKYEAGRGNHEEKTIKTIEHKTTILKEPYYINRECFNDKFVGLYNSYADTTKPFSALQESTSVE